MSKQNPSSKAVFVPEIPSQSRARASKRRPTAFSPPAVFSISRGTSLSRQLEGAHPTTHSLCDVVLGVSGVDDHSRRADLCGRVARLLEDLARAVADVVPRRADVDQVRGVGVERQGGGAQLLSVVPRGWLLPALRVGQEDLDAVGVQALGRLQRRSGGDVCPDDHFLRRHRADSLYE